MTDQVESSNLVYSPLDDWTIGPGIRNAQSNAQIGQKDAVQESSLHGNERLNDQLLEKRVERRDATKYRPEGLWIRFC